MNINTEMTSIINSMPQIYFYGKVTRIVGLVVEANLPRVPVGAVCLIEKNDGSEIMAEVIGLKKGIAVLMPIGTTSGIRVGDFIKPMRSSATVWVADSLLGRILDGNGNIMDGGPHVEGAKEYELYRDPVSVVNRQMIQEPMSVGVRAIDGLLTVAKGQRMSIMAGSGVGKSTLLGMIARNTTAQVNVIGLIGERGREVREFIENDLGPEGLARSVLVIATSDAPALVRMRAAFVTTTIAEYFRDQGNDVLLMMDSLTRFAMATREVGLSLGEPPTVKGYTPSLFATLPKLLERVGTTAGKGSITGLYTILTEGDDIQDPIADAVRAIVDGHIVLDRKLANQGHYPSIDVLGSISRVMSAVVNDQHKLTAAQVRQYYSLYKEMEDYINIGVYTPGKNQNLDEAIARIDAITNFLRQSVGEKTSFEETQGWLAQLVSGGV